MKLTLQEALKAPTKLAIDLETPSLSWWKERALLMGIYSPTLEGFIDFNEYDDATLSQFFKEFMKGRSFIFHNAKFDFHYLERWVDVQSVEFSDTMILAYMYKENVSHKLEDLSKTYFGEAACVKKKIVDDFLKKNKRKKKDITFSDVPLDMLGDRAVEDAMNTFKLFDLLRPKVYNTEVYLTEKTLVKVLLRMEDNGIIVDKAYLEQLDKDLVAQAKVFEDKYAGINLNSTKQLQEFLFNKLALAPSEFTGKGAPSTKTAALKLIDAPQARDLLEYRKIDKLKSAFTSNLLQRITASGRIHADFRQTGTETGRLSCSNPNLQQMPSKSPIIRRAFMGNKALWTFDYSQMEAVLYAVYNKEAFLLRALRDGDDVYTAMASKVYKKAAESITKDERKNMKTIFLGLMYGMGKDKFEKTTGVSFEAVNGYFNKKALQFKLNKQIKDTGYIETMFGRHRHLDDNDSFKAINSVIQGSAADILKMSMATMPTHLQDKLRLTVHDELVFEDLTKDEVIEIHGIMTSHHPLLKVNIGTGKTWWDCKENEKTLEEIKND
jgi:DNA polymerase I